MVKSSPPIASSKAAAALVEARNARGWTQNEAATAIGVYRDTYAKWELRNGVPRSRVGVAADALGVPVQALLGEHANNIGPAPEFRPAPGIAPPDANAPLDVPVMGTAAGALTGAFQITSDVVDYVRRPPGLIAAPGIYAIYIVGSSMEPLHCEGDLRFVHPGRPVHARDTVIVQTRNGEGAAVQAYIKRLISRDDDKLTVEQLNPPARMEFTVKYVQAVHKVLTINEMFGV